MNDLDLMRQRFRGFARDARAASPLYASISERAAEDGRLPQLILSAPPTQRNPALLFATVHHLLLKGAQHPLAAFYPSVRDGTSDGDPFIAFMDMCAMYEEEILQLLRTRNTQTNEVARCNYLLPAVVSAARGRPIALIELGASAGFLLNMDRYSYSVAGRVVGSDPTLTLRPEVRGARLPPYEIPTVVAREGIDLAPVDLNDAEHIGWLRACLWPEQRERAERFEHALAIARAHPPTIHRGDAVDSLPAIAARMPRDAVLCIYHSWAVAYLDREARVGLRETIHALGAERPTVWIGAESAGVIASTFGVASHQPEPCTTLASWDGSARVLAYVAHHGDWIDWRDP
jgi:hypothetical protein